MGGSAGRGINQPHDCTPRTKQQINQAYIQFYLLYCSLASQLSPHSQEQGKAATFNSLQWQSTSNQSDLVSLHERKLLDLRY